MGRLDGKRAIVTGGGSGIGRATCHAMAREGAGVLVVDIDAEAAEAVADEVRRSGGLSASWTCDVSDPAAVDALFESLPAELADVDVLFNNAGIAVEADAVATTIADWERTIAVNLRAVWLCSRAFIRRLRQRGARGAIVNTASVNAFFADANAAAYCASKGGVIGLTKAMALDHASEGVRVNCICPGWIETGMTAPYVNREPDPDDARRRVGAAHALGRMGRPDEIARLVVFLASDEASFLTGSAVVADGGLTSGRPLL